MRKIFGVLVLIIGTWLFLIGVLPAAMRGGIPYRSEELIIELVIGIIGAAVLLGGAALWGWSRKRIVLGIISTVVGGLLLLMSVSFAMMKSVSLKLDKEVPEVSLIWPLVFGIIFVTIGIVLIVKQRKIDTVATKKPV